MSKCLSAFAVVVLCAFIAACATSGSQPAGGAMFGLVGVLAQQAAQKDEPPSAPESPTAFTPPPAAPPPSAGQRPSVSPAPQRVAPASPDAAPAEWGVLGLMAGNKWLYRAANGINTVTDCEVRVPGETMVCTARELAEQRNLVLYGYRFDLAAREFERRDFLSGTGVIATSTERVQPDGSIDGRGTTSGGVTIVYRTVAESPDRLRTTGTSTDSRGRVVQQFDDTLLRITGVNEHELAASFQRERPATRDGWFRFMERAVTFGEVMTDRSGQRYNELVAREVPVLAPLAQATPPAAPQVALQGTSRPGSAVAPPPGMQPQPPQPPQQPPSGSGAAATTASTPPPTASGACRAELIQWMDDGRARQVYGVRPEALPASLSVTGLYRYEGTAKPEIRLDSNGRGVFEMHGAEGPRARENTYAIEQWWLEADCDGTLSAREGVAGTIYTLVSRFDRDRQGARVNRAQLTVWNDGRVVILGERIRVR